MTDSSRPRQWETIAIFLFGVVFITVLLVLAIAFPYPTPFQYIVFRVVLGLAAAGVAAIIPGVLNVRVPKISQAAGAIAVFLLIYAFSPASLLSQPQGPDDLRHLAEDLAKSLTIIKPQENERITTDVYNEMQGALAREIPKRYRLWVLAKDQYNYFLMYPPPEVVFATKSWTQQNIRLATPGRWKLVVCIANNAGSQWLKSRDERRDSSGFPSLHEGIEVVKSVTVERQ